jgi:uncharacterized OB-fold protein
MTDDQEISMTLPLLPLRGIRCRRCGFVATPIQYFGCEKCGADGPDLEQTTLAGVGIVLNAVAVHRRDQTLHIGSVHLAEGPMVRARLCADVVAGATVQATDADGSLLFVTAEAA